MVIDSVQYKNMFMLEGLLSKFVGHEGILDRIEELRSLDQKIVGNMKKNRRNPKRKQRVASENVLRREFAKEKDDAWFECKKKIIEAE